MEHEAIIAILTDRLLDNDHSPLSSDVQAHLAGCEQCRKAADEMEGLSHQMGKAPVKQPKASLQRLFDTVLYDEINRPTKKAIPLWTRQLAAACILLGMGFGIGIWASQRNGSGPDLAQLQQEVSSLKQTVVFNQLNDGSAGVRLQAINNVQEIARPDQALLSALEHALTREKNENVRMAAVYALSNYTGRQEVRDSMVAALRKETEPVIQILLINLLTEKKESKAKRALQDLIQNNNTPKEVQSIAQKSLQEL